MRVRVKICCIGTLAEARMAVRYGASALGLVSAMPSGPGVISDERIAEIASDVPPGVASFLLTSKRKAAEIVAQQRRAGTNTIQICDRLEVGSYRDLREAMPGIGIVQVIHVRGPESLEEAMEVVSHVDAILLDSGNLSLRGKKLGGTGLVHDWNISRRIREKVGAPVYLAGGLNAENVIEAITRVGPFGVDVCSGVRTDGKLDERKLANLMNRVSSEGS